MARSAEAHRKQNDAQYLSGTSREEMRTDRMRAVMLQRTLKLLALLHSLAKRFDAHLTRGVERHGRFLAGLTPPNPPRHRGRGASKRRPAAPNPARTMPPRAQGGAR